MSVITNLTVDNPKMIEALDKASQNHQYVRTCERYIKFCLIT
jgi:hypothetical protein